MEAGGRVIGDLVQPDAAGAKTAVLDLDGADDQHFALMAAPAAAGDRIVLAAAHDFGFVDLDKAGQRFSVRGQHAAAQLSAEQPKRVGAAAATLRCHWSGWPSDRRPRTTRSAAAWSDA